MRLVGASNWFVKGPFIVQSILYGAFAVIVVNLLFFGGLLARHFHFLNIKLAAERYQQVQRIANKPRLSSDCSQAS